MLFALPLSAGAADKAGKTEGTMDKMENKTKETTQEVKGAVSDSWLTSKAKIALFADDRVAGKDVRVETVNGRILGGSDWKRRRSRPTDIAKGIEGAKGVKNDLQVVPPAARKTVTATISRSRRRSRPASARTQTLRRSTSEPAPASWC